MSDIKRDYEKRDYEKRDYEIGYGRPPVATVATAPSAQPKRDGTAPGIGYRPVNRGTSW